MICVDSFVVITLRNDCMLFVSERQPVVKNRFHSYLNFRFIYLQYVTIRYISYKFANYRTDSSWDRPRSLDMQISRSQLDNL